MAILLSTLLHTPPGTNARLLSDVLRGKHWGSALEELTILVIEDDTTIQAMIDEALCDGGYEPAVASSGEEAVTLLKGGKTKYRVLVTDINLAGRIDGWEVARAARGAVVSRNNAASGQDGFGSKCNLGTRVSRPAQNFVLSHAFHFASLDATGLWDDTSLDHTQ